MGAREITSQWSRICRIGPAGPVTCAYLLGDVGIESGAFRGVVEDSHSRVSDCLHRFVVERRDAAYLPLLFFRLTLALARCIRCIGWSCQYG